MVLSDISRLKVSVTSRVCGGARTLPSALPPDLLMIIMLNLFFFSFLSKCLTTFLLLASIEKKLLCYSLGFAISLVRLIVAFVL